LSCQKRILTRLVTNSSNEKDVSVNGRSGAAVAAASLGGRFKRVQSTPLNGASLIVTVNDQELAHRNVLGQSNRVSLGALKSILVGIVLVRNERNATLLGMKAQGNCHFVQADREILA